MRRARIAVKVLVESAPGALLLLLVVLLVLARGVGISLLPVVASFTSFLAGAIATKRVLRKPLKALYELERFNVVAPLIFIVPLVLLLHVGYEYADLRSMSRAAELLASLALGLALFFITYPVTRRI